MSSYEITLIFIYTSTPSQTFSRLVLPCFLGMSRRSSFTYSKTNLRHTLISFIKDISLIITKCETGIFTHTVPFSRVANHVSIKYSTAGICWNLPLDKDPRSVAGINRVTKQRSNLTRVGKISEATRPSENLHDSVWMTLSRQLRATWFTGQHVWLPLSDEIFPLTHAPCTSLPGDSSL